MPWPRPNDTLTAPSPLPGPGSGPDPGRRAAPLRHRWPLGAVAGIGMPLVVGLVHVALVAPHYFVGSFDDDASYILTGARAPARTRPRRPPAGT